MSEVLSLLEESDFAGDEALTAFLTELDQDATAIRPLPSPELAALLAPRRAGRVRARSGVIVGVIVLGGLALGTGAAAASPDLRHGVGEILHSVVGGAPSSPAVPDDRGATSEVRPTPSESPMTGAVTVTPPPVSPVLPVVAPSPAADDHGVDPSGSETSGSTSGSGSSTTHGSGNSGSNSGSNSSGSNSSGFDSGSGSSGKSDSGKGSGNGHHGSGNGQGGGGHGGDDQGGDD